MWSVPSAFAHRSWERGVRLMLQVGFVLLSCGCRFQYRPILSFGCRLHNRLIPCCCGLIQFDLPSCHAPLCPCLTRAAVHGCGKISTGGSFDGFDIRDGLGFQHSLGTWDMPGLRLRVPHMKLHALKILPPCGVYITMLSCWSF